MSVSHKTARADPFVRRFTNSPCTGYYGKRKAAVSSRSVKQNYDIQSMCYGSHCHSEFRFTRRGYCSDGKSCPGISCIVSVGHRRREGKLADALGNNAPDPSLTLVSLMQHHLAYK